MNNLRYLWYDHVTRKTQKFIPWVARKLPKKLKYYVVINGMSEALKSDQHPECVSGMDILKHWEP